MEKQATEFGIRGQQATDELRKLREEWDVTVEGLKKEVLGLKKKEFLAKKSDIQEYKSSNDFQKEVEKVTFK